MFSTPSIFFPGASLAIMVAKVQVQLKGSTSCNRSFKVLPFSLYIYNLDQFSINFFMI